MAKTPEAKVVPIARFRRGGSEIVPELGEAPPPPALSRAQGISIKPAVDLSGRPTIWCLLGPGQAGKTVEARFLHGQAEERGGSMPVMAALDPGDRTLATWFDGVEQPTGRDSRGVARWLRDYLDYIVETKTSAVLDFGGGGEVALADILSTTPDLHGQIEAAGMAMVACYLLTPRITDLFVLKGLEDAGFQPAATVLLLNEGRADPTRPVAEVFDDVIRHSVFRKAVARGAQVIWMPALDSEVIEEIEKKLLPFGAARDGQVPEGASFNPIGGLRRSAVGRWMALMVKRHEPVHTWMP